MSNLSKGTSMKRDLKDLTNDELKEHFENNSLENLKKQQQDPAYRASVLKQIKDGSCRENFLTKQALRRLADVLDRLRIAQDIDNAEKPDGNYFDWRSIYRNNLK